MSDFVIDEKCLSCPVQCDLRGEYGIAEKKAEFMTNGAESLVGEEGKAFDAFIEDFAPDDESATELKIKVRKSTAANINDLEERMTHISDESRSYSNSCDGTLKMRATKEGKTYTVGVCTSALLYLVNDDRQSHPSVHVQVKTD